jgi:hypothetical protein
MVWIPSTEGKLKGIGSSPIKISNSWWIWNYWCLGRWRGDQILTIFSTPEEAMRLLW